MQKTAKDRKTLVVSGGESMSYEEAIHRASRDEAFKAAVYAMNTLLVHKGIYTQEEFQQLFTEWVRKEENKKLRNARSTQPASALA